MNYTPKLDDVNGEAVLGCSESHVAWKNRTENKTCCPARVASESSARSLSSIGSIRATFGMAACDLSIAQRIAKRQLTIFMVEHITLDLVEGA